MNIASSKKIDLIQFTNASSLEADKSLEADESLEADCDPDSGTGFYGVSKDWGDGVCTEERPLPAVWTVI